MRRGIGIGVMLLGLVVAGLGPGTVRATAAQPPLVFASETPPPPGTEVLAGIAAVVGTVAYAPFKAALICPETAVGAGVSLAVGGPTSAERLLRIGCTGTYVITPGMVRGQAEFEGGGAPIVEPPPLRLLPLGSQ